MTNTANQTTKTNLETICNGLALAGLTSICLGGSLSRLEQAHALGEIFDQINEDEALPEGAVIWEPLSGFDLGCLMDAAGGAGFHSYLVIKEMLEAMQQQLENAGADLKGLTLTGLAQVND